MTPSAQEPTPLDEKRVIELFDEAARTYGEAYVGDAPAAEFFRRRKEVVLAILARLAGGRLLDVGCGPGLMAELCLKQGFNYTGVDISPGMIAECQRRHGDRDGASFSVAKIQSLPFPDASFDALLCMGALEYLTAGAETQAIAEMARVLRSDGLLIISFLNAVSFYWIFDRWYGALRGALAGPPRWLWARLWPSYSVRARGSAVPFRKFRESACRRLLERSGLGAVETVFFDMGLMPSPLDRRLPRVVRRVSSRLERFATGSLRQQAKGFVLAARKQSTVTQPLDQLRADKLAQVGWRRLGLYSEDMMTDVVSPSTDLQRNHWNDWNAATREQYVDEISLRQADIISQWLDLLGRKDLDIIEIGCGAGWFSQRLTQYGKVTATDLADEVLKRAKIRAPSVEFVAGDFMNLPFLKNCFDVVVTLEVLAHVADQQAFIHKITSLLRPGGYLMLATQNHFVLKYFNRVPPTRPGQLRRWVGRRELREMVETTGFQVLQIFSITPRANRGIMHLVNSRKVNRPIRALFGDRVERLKERLGLGWTLMLLARK